MILRIVHTVMALGAVLTLLAIVAILNQALNR